MCYLFSSVLFKLLNFKFIYVLCILSFWAAFCFTNRDYRLIQMTFPPITPGKRGFTVITTRDRDICATSLSGYRT
jgi:hypothetical protein